MLRTVTAFFVVFLFIFSLWAKPEMVTVSQSKMNMNMLDRIISDGESMCNKDDGLKGIE
jgi:hypothetical protein